MNRPTALAFTFALGALSTTAGSIAQTTDQTPFVSFSGAKLRLGMSVTRAQEVLKQQELYLIATAPQESRLDELWFIVNQPTLSKGFHSSGLVHVTGARIVSIEKDWELDSSSSSHEEVLYFLLKTFIDENHFSCNLHSEQTSTSAEEIRTAWIVCGPKSIRIRSLRTKSDHSVVISGVDEILAK